MSPESDIRFVFYFLRYITVAYFLNDVDDGGEVVLPLANSKFEVFRLKPLLCLCLSLALSLKKTQAPKAISF